MKIVAALAVLVALSGCVQDGAAGGYDHAFGSFRASPVVVTKMSVNGGAFKLAPVVVDGAADTSLPRANGIDSMTYPSSTNGTMTLQATWVELLTGRAYQAAVNVPDAELQKSPTGRLEFAPLFGPNGEMIVSSDPLPTAEGVGEKRNIVTTCAARSPADDFDYRADPNSLPMLADALALPRPAVGASRCPKPAR
ncbi:MAG: hypothetical protein DI498_08535 [Paracoccus denitrificans]|nr:MAG: hypothetical protein DI498_08535 [Paracoccus denitrificans]PZO84311.1 MAG: hypothetical protein DI633_08535 [Paracoccus denitrificans]